MEGGEGTLSKRVKAQKDQEEEKMPEESRKTNDNTLEKQLYIWVFVF